MVEVFIMVSSKILSLCGIYIEVNYSIVVCIDALVV